MLLMAFSATLGGLHQGDLLSPSLFIMVTEASSLISIAAELTNNHSFQIEHLEFHQLYFVDDAILCMKLQMRF